MTQISVFSLIKYTLSYKIKEILVFSCLKKMLFGLFLVLNLFKNYSRICLQNFKIQFDFFFISRAVLVAERWAGAVYNITDGTQ